MPGFPRRAGHSYACARRNYGRTLHAREALARNAADSWLMDHDTAYEARQRRVYPHQDPNTVMAVVPDSNRISLCFYSVNNFSKPHSDRWLPYIISCGKNRVNKIICDFINILMCFPGWRQNFTKVRFLHRGAATCYQVRSCYFHASGLSFFVDNTCTLWYN